MHVAAPPVHRTADLGEAVAEQMTALNAKPFAKRDGSRLAVFLAEEQDLLRPLPPIRFKLADLRKAKVGPNYHVQVDSNFYSVSARLIGKRLDVRLTTRMVEVFDGAERVASHARLRSARGRYHPTLVRSGGRAGDRLCDLG